MPYWSIEGPKFDDVAEARRQRPVLKAMLVFGMVLAIGAAVVGVAVVTGPQAAVGELPPRLPEHPEQKFQTAAAVYGEQQQTTADDEGEADDGIEALFETMRDSVGSGDHAAYAACFDVTRLYQEIKRLGMFPEMTPRQETQFVAGMKQGMHRSLARHAQQLGWKRYEVKRIEMDAGAADEALVYTRLWDEQGLSAKVRWWLARHDDGWRIYDSEDLDLGVRMSTAMGVVASGGVLEPAPWVTRAKRLTSVSGMIVSGDIETAEETLDELADAGFPATFEAVRELFSASVYAAQERYDEAVAAIERADRLNPDMPVLDYLRAVSFNGQGRHGEALAAAERYASLLGGDALTLQEIGIAHRGIGNPERAAAAYREGLRDDPNATELIVELARVLPLPEKVEVGTWFTRTTQPTALFEGVAVALLELDENTALEALIAAMRDRVPDDPNASYYEAQLRYGQLRYEEAAALLREALPHAPLLEREYYLEALLDALIAAGTPVEAYLEAPDRATAFRYIADRLLWTDDREGLSLLIETHTTKRPDDRWLAFFQGELHLRNGRFEEAISEFGRGLETAVGDEQRSAYHAQLLTAYYRGGRAMDAYRSIAPTEATARMLAQLCAADEDDQALEVLIEAHQRRRPDDRIVHLWTAEVSWIRGDYERAASALQRHGATLPSDPDTLQWRDDRLVRSLVRLDRLDEALTVAESLAGDGNPFYVALVHAAAGRAEAARGAVEQCLALGYLPEMLSDDPDLGPLLTGLRITPGLDGAQAEVTPLHLR